VADAWALSLAQEEIWPFEQATPGASNYNFAEARWLEGPLDGYGWRPKWMLHAYPVD